MKAWMQTVALGSWKTTAIGFFAGIVFVIYPILVQSRWPTELEWALAFFSAAKGLLSKDGDKAGTGGPGDPIRGPVEPPSYVAQGKMAQVPFLTGDIPKFDWKK